MDEEELVCKSVFLFEHCVRYVNKHIYESQSFNS